MKLCNRCSKEVSDDAFSINDNYYCDICQDLPMIPQHKVGLFPCKHCHKMMVNPHAARKYHPECAEEGQRISTLTQLKKTNREQKERWDSLSNEKQLELISKEAFRVLHDESINVFRTHPIRHDTTKNSINRL